ncbi:hypothetical protein Glove_152g93 [Diversispora epigaea]|uniref:Condensin complex subunit 1 n=1 Tax=Diversispora epigaea TaxID=1348612 RepID=A0A397J2C6_9GLOM|nr:hypothetical protein Glove_152g93 [Diversispora epigaea]
MTEFFVLHEELLKQQDANYFILNEVFITELDSTEIDRLINDVTDKIIENSLSITNAELFDILRSFVKNYNSLKSTTMNRVLDIIISGFRNEYEATFNDLEVGNEDTYRNHQVAMEMYGFLLAWLISNAEDKAASKGVINGTSSTTKRVNVTNTGKTKRTKQTKSKSANITTVNLVEEWDWSAQKPTVLDLMLEVLELRINEIWTTSQEMNAFISLFTKSAYLMLENIANIKDSNIKVRVFKVLSVCVKDYNHAFGAQTSVIQEVQYYDYLSEPMAEFLHMLSSQYDHTKLAEEILSEISSKEFGDKDTISPKNFSKFLVKLSELSPKLVAKQIGLLIKHLEHEPYTMRCGLIEVLGNLIIDLTNEEQQIPNNLIRVNGFFDLLEERFLDTSSYCRSKVLQTYSKLCDLKTKFPKRRQRLTDLVIKSLEDKAIQPRKHSIKLLTKLISTHPFGVIHGGELSLKEWEDRLKKVEEELKSIQPPQEITDIEGEIPDEITDIAEDLDDQDEIQDMDMDIDMLDESIHQTSSPVDLARLQFTRRYYVDAVRFIHQINTAIPTLCQLLASTLKSEVIEVIDFFVTAHTYKMEFANEGIKKMLHLIWTKDNNDEGKGIRKRLIESYCKIYIYYDESLPENENVNMITKNLISLTFNATLAELTSLEQLLSTIMSEDSIDDLVIAKLWSVYSISKIEISKAQRRGAIIVLSMLAKAKMDIVQEKIDLLLKVGLGSFGREDLVLAKYTCIALQRLGGNKAKVKGSLNNNSIRLPLFHQIFCRLKQMIEIQTNSQEWFALAEQAINTIYLLAEHPDVLCEDIIKRKTAHVFGLKVLADDDMDVDDDQVITNQESFMMHPLQLSQLVFTVGHVAIKHIVHLEFIEAECKRRKAEADSKDKEKTTKNPGDDELEQVVGTTEDEFGEAIAQIREKELLFGEDSLLTVFGPLISNICANNKTYNHRTLQISATLALAKLMCVSSEFCENNLQLLFTILEKSSEPTIRSNIIIALGDMTVCFNNIIDENINYLYNRLSDPDSLVKKNTLMVLTHLILNGMIKVKGQLGEMAKCLEDEDQRISDLSRLFFTELASKDNAVYNNLPDMISNLSSGDTPLDEESFKKIMKFLFDFIEKEKHIENVVDKLCQRFKNLDDRRQWHDIAYCLSLLPYKNEKIIRKLIEGMPHYQDKLHEEQIQKFFAEIITKAKSIKPQRPELKQLIDEYEAKIKEFKNV